MRERLKPNSITNFFRPQSTSKRRWPMAGMAVSFIIVGFLIYSAYKEAVNLTLKPSCTVISRPLQKTPSSKQNLGRPNRLPLFKCPTPTKNVTCPQNPPPPPEVAVNADKVAGPNTPPPECPDYFRWIHEDLRPWRETGITRKMVDGASRTAFFRLVVVSGKAYVHWYRRHPAYVKQRASFTVWGFLQLLRKYPGRIPDLELVFDSFDAPGIRIRRRGSPDGPPALFHYCGDDNTADIVFPDWSFWGWPDLEIEPWEPLTKRMKEENEKIKWVDRTPYAYWKGNPNMSPERRYSVDNCNISSGKDWNAHLFVQDWRTEMKNGFKTSDLSKQCTYRYKIYMEGMAWSVSRKYIMACDSPNLVVPFKFYEFFTRSLMPMQHFLPVRTVKNCTSIKSTVDWGNNHQEKAEAIGKEGNEFILEKVSMDMVYDYMFHVLNEYSKLLRFKPTVPPNAVEYCSELMTCSSQEEYGVESTWREYMMKSMVNISRSLDPCNLPPPFHPSEFFQRSQRRLELEKELEEWERNQLQGGFN